LRRSTDALLISTASARTFWFNLKPLQWKVSRLVSQIIFVDQKAFLALARYKFPSVLAIHSSPLFYQKAWLPSAQKGGYANLFMQQSLITVKI
jgi:hypothetical protein